MFQWGIHLIPARGPISWRDAAYNQVAVVPIRATRTLANYLTQRRQLMRQIEEEDVKHLKSQSDGGLAVSAAATSSGSTTFLPDVPVLRITPPSHWWIIPVGELWAYRELLYFFVWRELKVRYKQTVVGAAWAVIQPF